MCHCIMTVIHYIETAQPFPLHIFITFTHLLSKTTCTHLSIVFHPTECKINGNFFSLHLFCCHFILCVVAFFRYDHHQHGILYPFCMLFVFLFIYSKRVRMAASIHFSSFVCAFRIHGRPLLVNSAFFFVHVSFLQTRTRRYLVEIRTFKELLLLMVAQKMHFVYIQPF